jgi:hypothetical protein
LRATAPKRIDGLVRYGCTSQNNDHNSVPPLFLTGRDLVF